MILHVDVKPVLAGDGGRGYVFRESEVAAPAEASACRRAKGNSVQKQPWLKLSPSRLSTLKLNVKVAVAIGSVRKNGIAKSAELPSQQAAPEFGPIHSAAGRSETYPNRSAKLLPQRFRFERW